MTHRNGDLSDPAFRAQQDRDFDINRFMADVAKAPRKTYEEISAEQRALNAEGKLTSGKDVQYDVARYLDVTEVAKLIRKALKDAFVGRRFSVRTDRFAGGTSIHVGYSEEFSLNKDNVRNLNLLLKGFESNRFDGMTDSASTITNWLSPTGRLLPAYCGAFGTNPEEDNPNPGGWELVQSGAKYIMSQRMF